jgi:hypothetical protein
VNTLYCLEEWRGEQRISPPGDKIHPWGTTSPLGSKFAPRGEVQNVYVLCMYYVFSGNVKYAFNFKVKLFVIAELSFNDTRSNKSYVLESLGSLSMLTSLLLGIFTPFGQKSSFS